LKIPLLDIVKMHAPIRGELLAAMTEVLDSGSYINGRYVERFETQLAEHAGTRRAVGVTSGSDALIVAMMALGVKPGDEVVTSAFTFFATAGAIVRLGAKPVFVDIDPVTFNIDPARIEDSITDRTVGIMPVHLFGQSADMDKINAAARKHGVWVLEDAAQSIGALYKGRMCGAMGTAGTYSFFPAKNLGGIGDGGAVVTNDDELADKMLVIREHGSKPKYHHKVVGGNFRLDALQAAVLSVKLPHLREWEEKRRKAAATYAELLAGNDLYVPPVEVRDCRHVFNQYELRVGQGKRDTAASKLRDADMGHAIYYPIPLHLQECFAGLGYKRGDLPVTEKMCDEVLAVPILVDADACKEVVSVLQTV